MSITRSKSSIEKVKKETPNRLLFEYPDRQDDLSKSVISFTQHDLNQLRAPRYLNDTIITFFMQYHLDKVQPQIKDRIHIFSSFFFAKIHSIRERQKEEDVSYKCASRWLGGVELFGKDFLIMPVCEKDHWLMVIICYPARKSSLNPKSVPDEELYEPAVFVLNSWYGCAPSVKRSLNQFLRYQWHVERGELRNFRIHDAKSGGMRLIFPKLPQQRNNYNCGVYMLNYFYCFLKNPRDAYIRMFRKRDMTDWFKQNDIDISCQRRKMTVTIHNLARLWKGGSQDDRTDQSSLMQQDHEEVAGQQSVIVIH